MNIYQSGLADNLTHPHLFTKAINDYLLEEEKLLLTLARDSNCIIEAGCTRGRYTKAITETGKNYIGIDIAPHHIADAMLIHKHNSKAIFYCADACNLEKIITHHHKPIKENLLVFPFNSFGILIDPARVLEKIKQLCVPIVIFTYTTDKIATDVRSLYYSTAGFHKLYISEEASGVRFTNHNGLDTIAYDEQWFRQTFARFGFQYRCISFGAIGRAYCNF